MWTIIGILFIYWLIGAIVIYWIADRNDSSENPAWVLIYAIGPIFWPAILVNYLKCCIFNKK